MEDNSCVNVSMNKNTDNSDQVDNLSVTTKDCESSFIGSFKLLSFYIEWYVFEFPFLLYHEIWHLIMSYPLYWMAIIDSKPKLVIEKLAQIDVDWKNNYSAISSFRLYITYKDSIGDKYAGAIVSGYVAFGPVLGVILLFLISPLWLWPIYMCKIGALWLSASDVIHVIKGVKAIKHIFK